MPRKKAHRKSSRKTTDSLKRFKNDQKNSYQAAQDFHQMEFHRYGLALVPDPSEKSPCVAFILKGGKTDREKTFCSCRSAKKKNCVHRTRLLELYDAYLEHTGGFSFDFLWFCGQQLCEVVLL